MPSVCEQKPMKILITSTPAIGHINPLFSIGRMLVEEGHDVVGLSASAMRDRIRASGARFHAFPKAADFDLRDANAVLPELRDTAPGLALSRLTIERLLIDPLPAQYEGLKQVLRDFPADIILGDNMFYGAFPMLLGTRSERPPIILCGTMLLHFRRDDGAPNFVGLLPANSDAQRKEYAAIAKNHDEMLYGPVGRYLNSRLAELGVKPLATNVHDAAVILPDAYLQLTVPSFEFPHRSLPATVHFVGTLPIVPEQAPLPSWAHELDGSRKVVLVTQGTFSNQDFGQLIGPTLAALAQEPDLLVIATAGGRPVDAIPGPIPGNARLASYLPFEWLLPRVDAVVTNGGYGSVNQALSFGIPLVTAGVTEDKADTNARVAWSGVGLNLRTQKPTPSVLRKAIRAVLGQPSYRLRASALAEEYGRIDTRQEILRIVNQLGRGSR
jgi:MGT family glycosyltransferase